MSSSNTAITPPKLETEHYDRWRREMKFWEQATNVLPKKRAATVFLTLQGKAREAILEIDPDSMNTDTGLTVLYDKLDELFKVDEDQAALAAYEKFEN